MTDVLAADEGFMRDEEKSADSIDRLTKQAPSHKKKKSAVKKHKKSSKHDHTHIQTLSQDVKADAAPKQETTPNTPAPQPDDSNDNDDSSSPNGSTNDEDTEEEKAEKAASAA